MNGKLIIFSAPSGTGKTTIVRYLMQLNLSLVFFISATSRRKRENEQERKHPNNSLTIFLMPSPIDILRERLLMWGAETAESLNNRTEKASFELSYKDEFDAVIINDYLETAKNEVYRIVTDFLFNNKKNEQAFN